MNAFVMKSVLAHDEDRISDRGRVRRHLRYLRTSARRARFRPVFQKYRIQPQTSPVHILTNVEADMLDERDGTHMSCPVATTACRLGSSPFYVGHNLSFRDRSPLEHV
jgi:hypothetical protein